MYWITRIQEREGALQQEISCASNEVRGDRTTRRRIWYRCITQQRTTQSCAVHIRGDTSSPPSLLHVLNNSLRNHSSKTVRVLYILIHEPIIHIVSAICLRPTGKKTTSTNQRETQSHGKFREKVY
ncbi:unnamed protein product [Ectocarpus sp. 13 AM-2016]